MQLKSILMIALVAAAGIATLILFLQGHYQTATAVALTPLAIQETISVITSWRSGGTGRTREVMKSAGVVLAVVSTIAVMTLEDRAIYPAAIGIIAGAIALLIGINLQEKKSRSQPEPKGQNNQTKPPGEMLK